MDDHLPITPKRTTAQADIRNYFHPSPSISPPALTTPSTHPIAQARSDAAHNAMFEEWKAPVYKPRMPRSKSDGHSIRKTPQSPQSGHACGQAVNLDQIQITSTRSQSSSSSAHRRAQSEDQTGISEMSCRSLTSGGETLSQIPLILLGNTAVMDHSLVPKPLKLASHHSPSPSADGSTITARSDTPGSFMESGVTSTYNKQGLNINPSFTGLLSDGSDVLKGSRHITTKPIFLRPESRPSRLTWDDEAVIYRLPSPALTPSVPEKARRILGTADFRSKIPNIQPGKLSSSQKWTVVY